MKMNLLYQYQYDTEQLDFTKTSLNRKKKISTNKHDIQQGLENQSRYLSQWEELKQGSKLKYYSEVSGLRPSRVIFIHTN